MLVRKHNDPRTCVQEAWARDLGWSNWQSSAHEFGQFYNQFDPKTAKLTERRPSDRVRTESGSGARYGRRALIL